MVDIITLTNEIKMIFPEIRYSPIHLTIKG